MEVLQTPGKPARHGKGHQQTEDSSHSSQQHTEEHLLNNRYNSIRIKVRAFNAYIASVFLCNSEIWTLTKDLENTINTFQRRQLRNILGIQLAPNHQQ